MPTHPHPLPRRPLTPLTLAALTTLLPTLPTLATNVSWSPDSDGLWTTPSNWSSNSLPTPSDDVTLSRGPLGAYTVTLDSGSQSIHSLTANDNLSLPSGTLSLSSPSTLNASFSLTGGTLTSTGSLTLAGPVFLSKGAITGTGTLSFAPTAVVTLDPGNPTGTLGGTGASETLDIQNAGSINVSAGAHLGANAVSPTLHNLPSGSINKTGTGTVFLATTIDNAGSINIHQGNLILGFNNTGAGSISVDSGATFSPRGTLAAATTLTGQGTLNIDRPSTVLNAPSALPTTNVLSSPTSGQVSATFNASLTTTALTIASNSTGYGVVANFNAPATIGTLSLSAPSASAPNATATFNAPASLTSLNLSAGTLTGPADLSPAGPSTWSGGTLAGTGHLVIPSTGSLSIAPANSQQLLARTLDNSGSLSDSGAPANSFLNLQSASINNLATGHVTLQNLSLWRYDAGPTFNNAGTLTKTGTTSITLALPLTNTGTLSVSAGTLSVSNTFSNTGTVSLSSGGTLSLAGPFPQLTGTTLSTGTYTLSANSSLSILPTSTVSITTLAPSASVTLSGSFSSFSALNSLTTNQGSLTLTGGRNFTTKSSLTNSGSLTVGPSSTLTLSGPFLNSGSLSLAGTLDLRSGPLTWPYAPGSPSPLDTLRQYLQTSHIRSSSADITHTLAYADSGSAVTISIALAGDANLDGSLDADDYALLDKNFAAHTPNAHWTNGDFNYDGLVNQQDYILIDRTYLLTHPTSAPALLAERDAQFGPTYTSQLLTSLPEPSPLFTACGLALPLLRRRANRT